MTPLPNPQELVHERMVLLLFACMVCLGAFWVAQRLGFFGLSERKKSQHPLLSLNEVLAAFGVFFFVEFIIAPVLMFSILGEDEISPIAFGWANLLSIILATGAVLGVGFALGEERWKAFWGDIQGRTQRVRDLLIGASTWLLSYPTAVFVGQIFALAFFIDYKQTPNDQLAIQNLKAVMADPLLFGLTILATCTLVPVLEETLFRGFLQTWFADRFGWKTAILATSFVFSLFHFSISQGYGNIEILPSLFILSCFLGFLFERQRSLWAPIALHGTFNAISILLFFVTSK